MTTLLSVQITIQDFQGNSEVLPLENLVLSISFNHISSLFKAPFTNLPLQLVNFPLASLIYFRFYIDSTCKAESQCSIEALQHSKTIEFTLDLESPDEQESPEKTRPFDGNESENLGKFRVTIEKEDFEAKDCQICPFIKDFSTVSQNTLEIMMEMNKNLEVKYECNIGNLGMRLKDFDEIEEITPQHVKNVKCLLLGVNEKLKVLELYKERAEWVGLQVAEEQNSRVKMQNAFKKACKDYLVQKGQLDSMVGQLNKRCEGLAKRNLHLEKVEKEYLDFKKNSEVEIELLKSKVSHLESNKCLSKISENLVKDLEASIDLKEKSEKLQKAEFSKVLQCYEQTISEFQSSISEISLENQEKSQKIKNLHIENGKLKAENDKLTSESLFSTSLKSEMHSKDLQIKELKAQLKVAEEHLEQYKVDCEAAKSQLESLSHRFHEGSKILYNDKLQLTSSNTKLTEENAVLKQKLEDFNNKQLESQYNSINTSENPDDFFKNNSKSVKLLEDCKMQSEVSNRFQSDIIKAFNLLVRNMIENSERHLMLQRLQSRLLLFLRDKECELQILRELVVDFQRDRQIYIPVRGDFIDNTLANYLNSRPGKLDIPFIRLDTGIYLFGTKRVVLRVENIGIVSNC